MYNLMFFRSYIFLKEVVSFSWLYVLFAAIVEVFWVIGLKYSDSFLEWAGTIIMIVFSFYFIIKACEELPAGTVYAVFTGSGAAAIALIDFTIFGEVFTLPRSEEHTSELQSRGHLVCRLLLEKKNRCDILLSVD